MRQPLKNKIKKKGQSLMEYVIVMSVVSMAMISMSTYAFRSVQAIQQEIQRQAIRK